MRNLILRDQENVQERAALVTALAEGEQSGISARRVPDILDALKGGCDNQLG